MFTKIKKYFAERRARRELMYTALLTLVNDSDEFYRTQLEAAEQVKKMNESFRPEELRDFMEQVHEFIKNPQLSESLYQQILKYGHEERISNQ